MDQKSDILKTVRMFREDIIRLEEKREEIEFRYGINKEVIVWELNQLADDVSAEEFQIAPKLLKLSCKDRYNEAQEYAKQVLYHHIVPFYKNITDIYVGSAYLPGSNLAERDDKNVFETHIGFKVNNINYILTLPILKNITLDNLKMAGFGEFVLEEDCAGEPRFKTRSYSLRDIKDTFNVFLEMMDESKPL